MQIKNLYGYFTYPENMLKKSLTLHLLGLAIFSIKHEAGSIPYKNTDKKGLSSTPEFYLINGFIITKYLVSHTQTVHHTSKFHGKIPCTGCHLPNI